MVLFYLFRPGARAQFVLLRASAEAARCVAACAVRSVPTYM